MTTNNSIVKTRLENGLSILLKEIHSAPLISQWIWYRVGSRNEYPGITGISHWVEHMQFKGTNRFPAGTLDKGIARIGGIWNAFTYLDWTAYFETMPSQEINLALELEADRMMNGLYTLENVETERTVIISERQGAENEPWFRLFEAVMQAAFISHPYRNDVIGSMNDLKGISQEKLIQHYRDYYVPGNAVLTLAGNFDADKMLAHLRELYEGIPNRQVPERHIPLDPVQDDERRVTVEGPGETTYIYAGWHVPPATAPDFWPIMVLDSLLTGPSTPNIIGGGISNHTSRLYQALVERELAVHVSGEASVTIDPYLYNISAIVHPEVDPAKVIDVLDDEIRRLQDDPPPVEDLHRAVKQAQALFAYGSESITNQAAWLGLAEMIANYDWFLDYLDKLAAVTPYDVQKAAQDYLKPTNRVLGCYLPTEDTPQDNRIGGVK